MVPEFSEEAKHDAVHVLQAWRIARGYSPDGSVTRSGPQLDASRLRGKPRGGLRLEALPARDQPASARRDGLRCPVCARSRLDRSVAHDVSHVIRTSPYEPLTA